MGKNNYLRIYKQGYEDGYLDGFSIGAKHGIMKGAQYSLVDRIYIEFKGWDCFKEMIQKSEYIRN